jgi:hypothetical protein
MVVHCMQLIAHAAALLGAPPSARRHTARQPWNKWHDLVKNPPYAPRLSLHPTPVCVCLRPHPRPWLQIATHMLHGIRMAADSCKERLAGAFEPPLLSHASVEGFAAQMPASAAVGVPHLSHDRTQTSMIQRQQLERAAEMDVEGTLGVVLQVCGCGRPVFACVRVGLCMPCVYGGGGGGI